MSRYATTAEPPPITLCSTSANIEHDEGALDARAARPGLESLGQLELIGNDVAVLEARQRSEEIRVVMLTSQHLDTLDVEHAVLCLSVAHHKDRVLLPVCPRCVGVELVGSHTFRIERRQHPNPRH